MYTLRLHFKEKRRLLGLLSTNDVGGTRIICGVMCSLWHTPPGVARRSREVGLGLCAVKAMLLSVSSIFQQSKHLFGLHHAIDCRALAIFSRLHLPTVSYFITEDYTVPVSSSQPIIATNSPQSLGIKRKLHYQRLVQQQRKAITV